MEKTDHQWEQEVVEEEEEEELLRGRKSRNQNGGTDITSKDAIALINGHSDENGENVHFSAHVNGAEDSTVVQKEVSEELEISSHGGFDPSQQGVVEELEISSDGGVDLSQQGGIDQLEISSNGGFDLSQQVVVQQLEISSNGGFDLSQQGVVEELEISSHGGFDVSQQGVPEELDIRNGGFEDVEKLLRAESEDVNGKLERCVYFDDDKGMWKCRECCWTYQSGSVCNDIIQKSNRHLHLLMNVITGNQEGLCFISETKGTGFTNGVSLTEQISIEFSNPEKKPADDGLKVNPPVDQILEHNNLHVSSIQPSEVSLQTEIDSEEIDLDVEGVLAKQNTHDLYCPNCNSCITRRVILRKRKRTIRTSGEEPKRNKLETLIPSQPDAISEDPTGTVDIRLDENPALEVNDGDRDQGPDIFRCLSCFSIFIPSEGGFKLFRMFGDKSKKESIQDTQQLPTVKRRWFSIFSSDKREVVVQKGTTQSVSVREDNLEVQSSNLNQHKAETSSLPELPPAETFVAEPNKNGKNIINSSAAPTKFEEQIIDVGEEFNNAANKGIDEKDTIVSSRSPIAVLGETDMNGKRVNYTSSQIPRDTQHQNVGAALLTGTITEDNDQKVKGGYKDEKEKLLSPTPVLVLGEKDMNEKVNTTLHIPSHVNEQNGGAAVVPESVTEDGSKFIKLSDRDGTYHSEFSQQSTVTTKWDIYTEKPLNVDTDLLISTVQDASLHQEGHVDIGQILKDMPSNDNNSGKDTIITVETERVETTASQISQDTIGSPQTEASPCADTLIGIVEQRDPTATNVRKLEIIKSIVYGGLLESITSLGVISSAAGADASTVNVLALGIANLIGGLFVIGHDLWEVKESQTGGASSQVSEQVDRYQELLGRRSNFTIHAVVAVISFIIFGLIPPVIYGFSFRQSNDRDFKLTAVAAASLLCIILLAVGKAYVRRPPKSYFKTMMYYVVIATMASGASYVAGGLIMKLLNKLGLFEPSQGLSVLESGSVNSAWASY